MRVMSRIVVGYLILGALGLATEIVLIVRSAGCSPGTCMEGPLMLLFVSAFLYGLGFVCLGALWLITLAIPSRRGQRPPMPAAPPDHVTPTEQDAPGP